MAEGVSMCNWTSCILQCIQALSALCHRTPLYSVHRDENPTTACVFRSFSIENAKQGTAESKASIPCLMCSILSLIVLCATYSFYRMYPWSVPRTLDAQPSYLRKRCNFPSGDIHHVFGSTSGPRVSAVHQSSLDIPHEQNAPHTGM